MSNDDHTHHPRNSITPVGLVLLLECYALGADLLPSQPAARRAAANFLIRAGLVKFRTVSNPDSGLVLTERGRAHVERLLALPILQEAQEAPQNAQEGPAPRFLWGYGPEGAQSPLAAGDALNTMVSQNGTFSNPLASSIFLEALTWDQQARVLERLGWRRA